MAPVACATGSDSANPLEVLEIVHEHTVGINALLSLTGGPTGLLATRGHRDLLGIGRQHREFGDRFYDPTWLRPHQERPVVARKNRIGVAERTKCDGSEFLTLEEDAVRRAARGFAAKGITSVAMCFMNSYVNGDHEQRAAAIVAEELPDAYIQTSALYPVTKEHERTVTVALDAYVGPLVVGYLERLNDRLLDQGFTGTLWGMMMNGGVATLRTAGRAPVFQLVSGPVGGVSGSVKLAEESSVPAECVGRHRSRSRLRRFQPGPGLLPARRRPGDAHRCVRRDGHSPAGPLRRRLTPARRRCGARGAHPIRGVRCNSVSPGPVDSALVQRSLSTEDYAEYLEDIPDNRMAQPHEVANAVVFLASREATYITGQDIAVDGGISPAARDQESAAVELAIASTFPEVEVRPRSGNFS